MYVYNKSIVDLYLKARIEDPYLKARIEMVSCTGRTDPCVYATLSIYMDMGPKTRVVMSHWGCVRFTILMLACLGTGAEIDKGSALDLVCTAPSIAPDLYSASRVTVPRKKGVVAWADARGCTAETSHVIQIRCPSEATHQAVDICRHQADVPLLEHCTSDGDGEIYIPAMPQAVAVVTIGLTRQYTCAAACSQGEYPALREGFDTPPYRCTRCQPSEADLEAKTQELLVGSNPNRVVYAACNRTSTAGVEYRDCLAQEPWFGERRALANIAECDQERGCPAGTWPQYRQDADKTCRLCPFNLSQGTVRGHRFVDVCDCPPGQDANGERCAYCAPGQYRSVGMAACQACDVAGLVRGFGAVSCGGACPQGSARLGGAAQPCQRCPTSLSRLQELIAHGTLISDESVGDIALQALRARACVAGTDENVTDATFFLEERRACFDDERRVEATGRCLACPDGERFDAESQQCVSSVCTLGVWNNSAGSCVVPLDFARAAENLDSFMYPVYSATTGAFQAQQCDADITEGVVNALNMTEAWLRRGDMPPTCVLTCDAGYTPREEGGPCVPCAPGFVKQQQGVGPCVPCPAGTRSEQWAHSHTCRECPAGTFSTQGQHACTPCLDSTTAGYFLWRSEYPAKQDAAVASSAPTEIAAHVQSHQLAPIPDSAGVVWLVDGWVFRPDRRPLCEPSRDALLSACPAAGMAGPNCYRCAHGADGAWECQAADNGVLPCSATQTRNALTGDCEVCSNATCTATDAYLEEGQCPPAGCRSCLAVRPDASLVVAAAEEPRRSAAACRFECPPGHVRREFVRPLLEQAGKFTDADGVTCVKTDAPDLQCPGVGGAYLQVDGHGAETHLRCTADPAPRCGASSSAVPRNVALPTHWYRVVDHEISTGGVNLEAVRQALSTFDATSTVATLTTLETGLAAAVRLPAITVVADNNGELWRAMLAGEPLCQCMPGFFGVSDTTGTSLLCASCPQGHTSPGGAISSEACVCAPGYYNSNTSNTPPCVPCPMGRGFVCPGGRGGPAVACDPRSDTIAPHAFSRAAHCRPDPGFRIDGRGVVSECHDSASERSLTTYDVGCTIQACAPGSVAGNNEAGCACDAGRGFVFHAESQRCQCLPGWFQRGEQCEACASGTYCPGDGTMLGCPDSRATSPPGSTHPQNCTCPRGYYWVENKQRCFFCPDQYVCHDNKLFNCNRGTENDKNLRRMSCLARRLSAPHVCPLGAVKITKDCKNIDHPDFVLTRYEGPQVGSYKGMLLVNLAETIDGEVLHVIRGGVPDEFNDWVAVLNTTMGTAIDDAYNFLTGRLREYISIAAGLQIICLDRHVLTPTATTTNQVAGGFYCTQLPSGAVAADSQPVSSGLALLGPRGLADPMRLMLAQNKARLLSRGAHLQWRPFWRCQGDANDILGACFSACAGALEHREHVVNVATREVRQSAPIDATTQRVWGMEVLALARDEAGTCLGPRHGVPVDPTDALTRTQWQGIGVPALDPGTCLQTPDGVAWHPVHWTSTVVWFERAASSGDEPLDIPALAPVLLGETPLAVTHAALAQYNAMHLAHDSIVRDRNGGLWRCLREHRHHVPHHVTAWTDATGRVFMDLLDVSGALVARMSEPTARVGPDERVQAAASLAAWAYESTVELLPAYVAVTCSSESAIRLVSCRATEYQQCLDTNADTATPGPFCASSVALAQHHLNSDSLLIAMHDGALWRLVLTSHAAVAVPRPDLKLSLVPAAAHGVVLGLHAPFAAREFGAHETADALEREEYRAHWHVCAYRVHHAAGTLSVNVERINVARNVAVETVRSANIPDHSAQANIASGLLQRFSMGGLKEARGAVQCGTGAVLSTAIATCSDAVRVLLVCSGGGESVLIAADADFASGNLANITLLGARQLPPRVERLAVAQRFAPVYTAAPDSAVPVNAFEVKAHVALEYRYWSETDAAVMTIEEFDFACDECGSGLRRGASGRCECFRGHALVCLPCDSHLCRHQRLTWNATESGCYAPAEVRDNTRAHLECLPCTGGVHCTENTPVSCPANQFTQHHATGCECPVNATIVPRTRAFIAEPARGAVVRPDPPRAGCIACDTDRGEICHTGLGTSHSLMCPETTQLALTTTVTTTCPTGVPGCMHTAYAFHCKCRDRHEPTATQRLTFPAPARFSAEVYTADWSPTPLASLGFFHTVAYEVIAESGCVRPQYAGPKAQTTWAAMRETVVYYAADNTQPPVPCPSAAPPGDTPPPLITDAAGFAAACESACRRADGLWLNGTRCVPIPDNSIVVGNVELRECAPGTHPEPDQRATCETTPIASTRYNCAPGFFAAFPAQTAAVAAAAKSMRTHLHTHPFTRHDLSAAASLETLLDSACLGSVWETDDGATQRVEGLEACRYKHAIASANVTAPLDRDGRTLQAVPVCVPCLLPFLECKGGTHAPTFAPLVDAPVFGTVQRRACPPARHTASDASPFQAAAGLHIASCFREGVLVEVLPELPALAHYPWPMAILIEARTGVSATLTRVLNYPEDARRLLYMASDPAPQAIRTTAGTQYLIVGSIDTARVLADQHALGAPTSTPTVVEELLRVPRAWLAAVQPAVASDPAARPLLVPGGLLRNAATVRLVASVLGPLAGSTAVLFQGDDTAVRTALGDDAYLAHTPACRTGEQCPVLVSAIPLEAPHNDAALPAEPVPAPALAMAPRAECPLDFEASTRDGVHACALCVSGCDACADFTVSAQDACAGAYAHLNAWPTHMQDFVCRADGSLVCV